MSNVVSGFSRTVLVLFCASCLLVTASLHAVPAASIVEAVKNADAATVRQLIKDRTDVNTAEADGTTALHWAVRLNDVPTAELLLRAGANVKAVNRYGVTPFSVACTNGNTAMVKLLLDAGADPNTTLPGGETALMSVARTGSIDAVKALIGRGVDVNAKEAVRGQTALMWAASEGHAQVVKALVDHGADIKLRSTGGFTAFLFAVRDGRMDVAKILLAAGADVNEAMPSAGRPRGPAAAAGYNRQEQGLNAFLLATTNAHYELALALVDAGADPNAAPLGWTVLHQITGVRKVGLYGSNDPAPEGSGKIDSLEFVRQIVKRGADVNARATRRPPLGTTQVNPVGATPFLLAARTADVPLMRELIKLGADPLMPNADNTTPLMIAAGVGTNSPPEDPGSEAEVVEAVKLALELGNDINAVDKNGETAMHGAAYKQMPAAVRLLAERGAKVEIWNTKDKKGWTPLKITQGVHRGMNIQKSPPTEAAVREVMIAAGVEPVVPPGSSTEPSDGKPYEP
jgi:ankyrin repeat protein